MAKSPYKAAVWPRLRLAVFERDGWRCQIGRPGCTDIAQHCDHVIPWSWPPDSGGAWFDPSNLRAACAHCNIGRKRRSARELGAAARRKW